MDRMQWARLKTHAGVPLRRGAWYRVVPPLTRLEVVVSVQGKPVTVPRPFVEIRATAPREWSVLRDPQVAPARTPPAFRRGYLVCPACRNRVPLPATQVAKQLCPGCHETFLIAWADGHRKND